MRMFKKRMRSKRFRGEVDLLHKMARRLYNKTRKIEATKMRWKVGEEGEVKPNLS